MKAGYTVAVKSCDGAEKLMTKLLDRITINAEQCGGRPCIRGMRIRVTDILDLFAAGLTATQILEEMPDLEAEDLQAALQYAARRLDHPVLKVEKFVELNAI
jgi:uncharacterized protein (DUF433 family)